MSFVDFRQLTTEIRQMQRELEVGIKAKKRITKLWPKAQIKAVYVGDKMQHAIVLNDRASALDRCIPVYVESEADLWSQCEDWLISHGVIELFSK